MPFRRFCAVCLARVFKVHVRWTPSEFNNSDEGSRIFDTTSSKNVTAALDSATILPSRSQAVSDSAIGSYDDIAQDPVSCSRHA